MALEFGRLGFRVAVSARRVGLLETLATELRKMGAEVLHLPCDVTDERALEETVARVVETWGRLDIAIANAGFAVLGSVTKLNADDWRRQFDVNVVGLTQTARVAITHLHRTGGRLVLLSSAAAFVPSAHAAPYGASKAAVRAIGQAISVELHGSGVSCTTIYPGFVESDIGRVNRYNQLVPDKEDSRPAVLMWKSDRAARVMVRAILKRRRNFFFTAHGRLGAFLGRHFPDLLHRALTSPLVPVSLSER